MQRAEYRELNVRAMLGGMFGWMVDVYDLTLVLFIASIIGKAFFPPTNPIAMLLYVFATYSLTLLARPLGGVIFGHVADRVGRRITMVITLLGLGLSSAATGILPTYAEWGLLATVLFVLLRLIVGIFVGGEVSGSHLIAIESSSPRFRGFVSGVIESGYYWGYALAAFTFALLSSYFGKNFATYGWRYAFLVGLAVAVVGILIRLVVEEPEIYVDVKRSGKIPKVPIAQLFREQASDALKALLLLAGIFWVAYATLGYMPTYLTNVLKMPRSMAFWGLTYASLIGGVLTIVGGVASNYLTRRGAFTILSLIGIALTYPLTLGLAGSNYWAFVASAGVLISVMGTGGIMLAYLSELFPTRFRGSAVGFLWNMASIGAIGALLTAPIIVAVLGPIIGYVLLLIIGYDASLVGDALTRDRTGVDLAKLQ